MHSSVDLCDIYILFYHNTVLHCVNVVTIPVKSIRENLSLFNDPIIVSSYDNPEIYSKLHTHSLSSSYFVLYVFLLLCFCRSRTTKLNQPKISTSNLDHGGFLAEIVNGPSKFFFSFLLLNSDAFQKSDDRSLNDFFFARVDHFKKDSWLGGLSTIISGFLSLRIFLPILNYISFLVYLAPFHFLTSTFDFFFNQTRIKLFIVLI